MAFRDRSPAPTGSFRVATSEDYRYLADLSPFANGRPALVLESDSVTAYIGPDSEDRPFLFIENTGPGGFAGVRLPLAPETYLVRLVEKALAILAALDLDRLGAVARS